MLQKPCSGCRWYQEARSLRDRLEEAQETLRQYRKRPKTIVFDGLKLGRTGRSILFELYSAPGMVSWERLQTRIVLQNGKEALSMQALGVALCRLRTRLGSLEPPVGIITEWGEGIRLDDVNRRRLQARLISTGQ